VTQFTAIRTAGRTLATVLTNAIVGHEDTINVVYFDRTVVERDEVRRAL